MARQHANDRGILVLAASYWMLVILLLLSSISTVRSFAEVRAATSAVSAMQAIHTAEAGVDQSLRQLTGNPNFAGTDNGDGVAQAGEWQALPDGSSFWIRVTNTGPTGRRIHTRGMSDGVQRQLEVLVSLQSGLPEGAILSDGPVNIIGETGAGDLIEVHGNIVSNFTGPESIFIEDTRVMQATDATTGLPIPNSGSIILMNVPSGTTPTLYRDPGRSITPGLRDQSTVAGTIGAGFSVNAGITSNPTTVIAETEGAQRHIGLVSRGGSSSNSPPNGQPTTVAGDVRSVTKRLTMPPVTIPPPSPITVGGRTFANDCSHDFVFHENNNTLTEVGAPFNNLYGGGIANRKLPGGTPGNPRVYCFRSFKGHGAGAADTPKLLFDGPVVIYINSSGAGKDVELGRPSMAGEQEWNSYVNWRVDAGNGPETREANDLWIMVKGATDVEQFRGHLSGSIYAPESEVTVTGGSNADSVTGMVAGATVTLINQARIRTRLPAGGGPPSVGGAIVLLSWREL